MHSFFTQLSRWMAYAGGAVLSVLVVLTCASVAGRLLNGVLHDIGTDWALALIGWGIGPVNGDFEIVEAGMAFAIFAFLPLCQIGGGHASVDILTSLFPDRLNRWLRWLTELVFALVLIVIAWQLFAGMSSKLRSGQTSLLLEYPVWWGYGFALTGAVVSALVAGYVATVRTGEMLTGRTILPPDGGAEH